MDGISKSDFLLWDDDLENVKAAKDFGFMAELYTNLQDYSLKLKNYQL